MSVIHLPGQAPGAREGVNRKGEALVDLLRTASIPRKPRSRPGILEFILASWVEALRRRRLKGV
ncbi:MAG: hypothetical protein HQL66_00640 [Magnetococcales bacterium]|nr:hypothetical protein [Magnetococcales bacterium]